MNFYNEIDPYAAQWLRNLIAAGHIPAGVVDERSIEDITPDELRPYTQCHFFAGIAGWSHALALAGWPSDRPVWTGSCPCQPFSAAGKGAGFDDQRHLWPAWFHLIRECRPSVIFGEQVASKDAEPWVDLVHADLDDDGFTYYNSKSKRWQGLEWSQELTDCVEDAKRLWRRFGREWLFESKPKGKHVERGVGPYTPSGLRALWRVARAKAGLQDVRLHDLRAKSASDAGSDEEARQRLGHTDGKVTRRHYRRKMVRSKPTR